MVPYKYLCFVSGKGDLAICSESLQLFLCVGGHGDVICQPRRYHEYGGGAAQFNTEKMCSQDESQCSTLSKAKIQGGN